MPSNKFREAVGDVSAVFRRPREILEDQDLAITEKVVLLRQWETDMRLILIASEENMRGKPALSPAELLREIRDSLRQLGETTAEHSHPAPDKSGGG